MMRRLLLEPKTEGYPTDFLLARLRGRRRESIDVSARRLRESTDPWSSLQSELCWLFRTMDRKMRREFGFCFLYFELRRLLNALRRLSGRNRDGIVQLAIEPLLHRDLIRQLQTAKEILDAVRVLDVALEEKAAVAPQLEKIMTEQGYRQMEERLVTLFFQSAVSWSRKPILHKYFSELVDLHNVLSILKFRRWNLSGQQKLLPGGTYSPEKWQVLQRVDREPQLLKVIGQISGSEEFDTQSVEHSLLCRIHHRLHRQARAEPESFLFLDYLWECYLRAKNLGLQQWAGGQLAAWEKLG
jgi:hypothetical protein